MPAELLILDLDDTIFETKSIPLNVVAQVFDGFRIIADGTFDNHTIDLIIDDLWIIPFDHVANKYKFSNDIKDQFASIIQNTSFSFDIKPFDDYHLLLDIEIERILVTTGFTSLQMAKIDSMEIEQDFTSIYIDDILASNRIFKIGIIQNILSQRNFSPDRVIVIGDNPKSELIAANELGIHTVQMAKYGQKKSDVSDHYIKSYKELPAIIAKI